MARLTVARLHLPASSHGVRQPRRHVAAMGGGLVLSSGQSAGWLSALAVEPWAAAAARHRRRRVAVPPPRAELAARRRLLAAAAVSVCPNQRCEATRPRVGEGWRSYKLVAMPPIIAERGAVELSISEVDTISRIEISGESRRAML